MIAKDKPSSVTTLPVKNRNPKVNIHSKTAKTYKPRREEYYIRDTKLEGFYIRVRPNGRMTYGVKSRLSITGEPIERGIGLTQLWTATDARKRAEKFIRDCKSGIDPRITKKKDDEFTLKALATDYLSKRQMKASSKRDMSSRLAATIFWKKDIRNIVLDDIHKWWRSKETSKLNKLSYLHVVLEWCVKRNLLKNNIAKEFRADIGGIKTPPPRTRSIRKHELKDWLLSFVKQAAPHPKYYDKNSNTYPAYSEPNHPNFWKLKPKIRETQRDYILFLLLTGKRRGESGQITWDDLNWENKELPTLSLQPEITKKGRIDIIAMSDVVAAMLDYRKQRPNKHEKWVFENVNKTGPLVNPNKSLHKISNYEDESLSIGIPDSKYNDKNKKIISPHDLRRTVRNTGGNVGYSNYEMKDLLGHQQGDITEGYYVERNYERQAKQRDHIENNILGILKWWILVFWYDCDVSLLDNMIQQEDDRPKLGKLEKFKVDQSQLGHPQSPFRPD